MLLVKVGGGDLDLAEIARDLASLGRPFVLLHGANRVRDALARDLGRPLSVVESLSGYTSVLTDDDAIDLLMAAYAGIRNKRMVEALRRAGVNAVGLTGLDGGMVTGERTRGIRVREGGRKRILLDLSGRPRRVNGHLLRTLLEKGYTPVLTVPIAGEDGTALNTENDDILTLLARELDATEVVSLMEAPGLLADRDDPTSLVTRITPEDLPAWEARVKGRMRRKIRALRDLFEGRVDPSLRVCLGDGRGPAPVRRALAGEGTVLERMTGVVEQKRDSASGGWLDRQARHELDVYGKRGLTLMRGEGARVWDAEGREYVDCIGGQGALALGHRHPVLAAALRRAEGEIWHIPGSFGSPGRTRFLERLHGVLPSELSRTFLSNSGAEAVEAALKIARTHTLRRDFVGVLKGFHGRTAGALSLTAEPRYRAPFEPLLGGAVRWVPLNDEKALGEAMTDEVAALVLEPVQGEGGVHPATTAFLRRARELADAHGALLVFDEVQTGFGRTGRLFAFEHHGILPDILCLAKSIAGGLPLGATVVREGITLDRGLHGSTFGGNPLAVAVADATLQVLTGPEGPALLEGAERKGRHLVARLEEAALPRVREVRQVGLMVGIQLRGRVQRSLVALQDRGILAMSAGPTVLRLLPPLVISDEVWEGVVNGVIKVLEGDAVLQPS